MDKAALKQLLQWKAKLGFKVGVKNLKELYCSY